VACASLHYRSDQHNVVGREPNGSKRSLKNSECSFRNTFIHFGVKVKQDHVMFPQVFYIGPQTCITIERAQQELSIDMAVSWWTHLEIQ